MAGGMCDCGGPGLEAMSTKDLMWLERIMEKGDPGTALAARMELCRRRNGYVRQRKDKDLEQSRP